MVQQSPNPAEEILEKTMIDPSGHRVNLDLGELERMEREIANLKTLIKELADELEEEIGAVPWDPFWDLIARSYEARGEPVPDHIKGMRSKKDARELFGG
jgi:hypothetical protein